MALYITINEADTHFNKDIFFYSKWAALSDTDKERYIVSAMRHLDSLSEWCGYKTNLSDEYEFPRDFTECWQNEDLTDVYYRNQNIIPIEVKQAMFIIVKELYDYVTKYTSIYELQNKKINTMSDGNISISVDKAIAFSPSDTKIIRYIYPFTLMGYANARP